ANLFLTLDSRLTTVSLLNAKKTVSAYLRIECGPDLTGGSNIALFVAVCLDGLQGTLRLVSVIPAWHVVLM
ncbi:MAG TPA: hypothetical protein VF708_13610, partial [Pyrinomonadaceae bacterium]